MALTENQILEITSVVRSSLDRAERIWRQHGSDLIKSEESIHVRADAMDSAPVASRIPDHRLLGPETEIGNFIALVADMRESSRHLQCAISHPAKVQLLQRVYYETSALLPALQATIAYQDGSVTEYLGDGVLALFKVADDRRHEMIRKSYRAAKNCVGNTRAVVNDELRRRYCLPEVDLGVGLAYSSALVGLVGLPDDWHPKVIGSCVYHATKLAGGSNEVCVDEKIYREWPTSDGGKLRFMAKTIKQVKGYVVE